MVSKPAPAVYRSEEIAGLLKGFNSTHKFNKWINDMELVLKGNMFAGHCVRKNKIPDHYRRRYGVNNLITMIILKVFDPVIRLSSLRDSVCAH
jgi:hypothetical protein